MISAQRAASNAATTDADEELQLAAAIALSLAPSVPGSNTTTNTVERPTQPLRVPTSRETNVGQFMGARLSELRLVLACFGLPTDGDKRTLAGRLVAHLANYHSNGPAVQSPLPTRQMTSVPATAHAHAHAVMLTQQQLKILVASAAGSVENLGDCCICCEALFGHDQAAVRILDCGHPIHGACFARMADAMTHDCPLCRAPTIVTGETPHRRVDSQTHRPPPASVPSRRLQPAVLRAPPPTTTRQLHRNSHSSAAESVNVILGAEVGANDTQGQVLRTVLNRATLNLAAGAPVVFRVPLGARPGQRLQISATALVPEHSLQHLHMEISQILDVSVRTLKLWGCVFSNWGGILCGTSLAVLPFFGGRVISCVMIGVQHCGLQLHVAYSMLSTIVAGAIAAMMWISYQYTTQVAAAEAQAAS